MRQPESSRLLWLRRRQLAGEAGSRRLPALRRLRLPGDGQEELLDDLLELHGVDGQIAHLLLQDLRRRPHQRAARAGADLVGLAARRGAGASDRHPSVSGGPCQLPAFPRRELQCEVDEPARPPPGSAGAGRTASGLPLRRSAAARRRGLPSGPSARPAGFRYGYSLLGRRGPCPSAPWQRAQYPRRGRAAAVLRAAAGEQRQGQQRAQPPQLELPGRAACARIPTSRSTSLSLSCWR